MRDYRALAFWVLPPILATAVVSPFMLTRGEGPTGERVASIVLWLMFAAFVQWILYRATSSRGRS